MERLKAPLYAQMELTFACNLACLHCYNEPRFSEKKGKIIVNKIKKEQTGKATYLAIAEELAKHEVFGVTLTGGEVFAVRDRFYPTLEALAQHNIDLNVNSNLTLATEEDASILGSSGIGVIMTSVASYESETHDKLVGKAGSHQQTLKGIELMVNQNVFVVANMVVSRKNKDQVYHTGKFLHELGVDSLSAAQAVPSISGGKLHLEQALSFEEVIDYLEQLHQVKEETGMYVRLTIPLPYCSIWESRPHLRSILETSSCTAGRTMIQISPTGEVKPCPMVSHSYGNILEEGLDVIWKKMNEWSEDKYVPETCKSCDLVDRCKGACRAEAERMAGSLDKKHPYSIKPVHIKETVSSLSHLKAGTRLTPAKGLKARRENDKIYILSAKGHRYMVASEGLASFLLGLKSMGSFTLNNDLASDAYANQALSAAVNAGVLERVV